jgi:hypothetical protein
MGAYMALYSVFITLLKGAFNIIIQTSGKSNSQFHQAALHNRLK